MTTDPDTFLKAIAPYRQGIVVAVEWMFTWYWLADLCADEGIPFVLGHALSMKAIHGGKAKHDQIDSQKIAAVLRGGRLPQAYVSPAKRRATRDVLRRRRPLAHQRAALLAHVQNTPSQSHRPAIGTKSADKANRAGVAERCADAAVHQSLAVALARIPSDDALRRAGALPLVTTAKPHAPNPRYRRPTVPGIGTMLRLVLLYAIHAVNRFPRVQAVVSSGRLVPCARESAGNRDGTAGAKIGQAHRKWAFSAAAVLGRRDHPAAQKYLARVEKKHAKGHAWTLLAQKLARAVSDRLKRPGAFDKEKFFQR